MEIVNRNDLIDPELDSFENAATDGSVELEINLKALRLSRLKVPHSGFSSDVRAPSVLPEISLEEVAHHDYLTDCWIVVYDRVYDVTKFLESHPGGEDVILDYAGRDATLAFRGTGHSKAALKLLQDHVIGELPEHQRIFRCTGSLLKEMSELPE